MEKQVFDELLNDTDRAVIAKGGYGKRRGFGTRPLLLVMNLQTALLGEGRLHREQPWQRELAWGEVSRQRVENILRLRDAARKAAIPVFYTRKISDSDRNLARINGKAAFNSRLLSDHPDSQLLSCLAPLPGELTIEMCGESAFFATPLESYLTKLKIDTLIITGTSTSGECRATAVDAVTRTLNLGMVEDCLIERISASHKNALLDIWMKFGDVIGGEETLRYFESLNKIQEE